MTRRPDPDKDAMQSAVRRVARRETRKRTETEPSAWQHLSMIGALGWLIVVPPIAGGLLGHWLDQKTGHLILWAAILIPAGIVLGAWLAWQRANRE